MKKIDRTLSDTELLTVAKFIGLDEDVPSLWNVARLTDRQKGLIVRDAERKGYTHLDGTWPIKRAN